MKNVKELTERLVKEEEELIGTCFGAMNFKGFAEMDTMEFELTKGALKLMNTMNELMVEYARVIDDMNAKLDRIEKSITENKEEA